MGKKRALGQRTLLKTRINHVREEQLVLGGQVPRALFSASHSFPIGLASSGQEFSQEQVYASIAPDVSQQSSEVDYEDLRLSNWLLVTHP